MAPKAKKEKYDRLKAMLINPKFETSWPGFQSAIDELERRYPELEKKKTRRKAAKQAEAVIENGTE